MEWCEKCKKYHESTTGGLCPGATTNDYGVTSLYDTPATGLDATVKPVEKLNAALPPAGQMAVENRKDNQDLARGGVKYDGEKLARFDLIPQDVLYSLATLYGEGAKKYSDNNWARGMRWGRVTAALMRHLAKWMAGEEFDPEGGQHHLDSVIWSAMTLRAYTLRGIGEDDRLKVGIQPVREGEEPVAKVGESDSHL